MDAMECIHTRRSVRNYTDQDVSDETVKELLAAAMAAPSAGNAQPWKFIVVRDRELLNKVTDFHPYAKMITKAPVAIVVCGDLSAEKYEGYWVQDCSAATQNLLLAAHAKGLGAVWTGVYPDIPRVEGCRALFNLPENIQPLCVIPLGYAAENKGRADRYNEEFIHYDRW